MSPVLEYRSASRSCRKSTSNMPSLLPPSCQVCDFYHDREYDQSFQIVLSTFFSSTSFYVFTGPGRTPPNVKKCPRRHQNVKKFSSQSKYRSHKLVWDVKKDGKGALIRPNQARYVRNVRFPPKGPMARLPHQMSVERGKKKGNSKTRYPDTR